MADDLYHTKVLRLAAEAVGNGRLADPDASVTLSNPMCGDRITLDLRLDRDKVAAIGHDVKACVLCQASASAIGRHAVGEPREALQAVADQVAALLKQEHAPATDAWAELDAFRPVASYKSRPTCVLLPFRALLQAFDQALAKVAG